MHGRSYIKAIFAEAIDQDFVQKNPTRKLMVPKGLRAVDKTILTWDQLRLLLASVPLRDRILLTLDMTETFRPSELFALRCDSEKKYKALLCARRERHMFSRTVTASELTDHLIEPSVIYRLSRARKTMAKLYRTLSDR
jgi:site-specific recombinase XerC